MKQFKIIILISITIFFVSCGTIKKGFENKNKNNADEFLVKKKSPLVMPPDFNELPIPRQKKEDEEIDENQFRKLISKNKEDKIINNINEKKKSFENSLLEKIKGN